MRRINHSTSAKSTISSFTDRTSENKIFHRDWEVQLLAAAVGFQKSQCFNLKDKTGSAIEFSTFNSSGLWPGFINCMALVEEGNPDILTSDSSNVERRISLFEKYAEAGFTILESEVVSEMSLVGFADFIIKFSDQE